MNTPVSFEGAKLLREKTLQAYVYRGIEHQDSSYKGWLTKDKLLCDISAPTIAEVVMWLYEKHGIWISVYTMDKWLPNGNDKEQLFDYSLKQMKRGLIDIPKKPEEFNSPREAYEVAISYTLKNLI